VEITEGTKRPIQINIFMNNMAGIFQVDELLKQKMDGSGIEKYIIICLYIDEAQGHRLIKEFEIN
jgi:metal-dependent HD superfamily phosphatase/phosphodiesterase